MHVLIKTLWPVFLLVMGAAAPLMAAQTFPSKPIRAVVTTPPGSGGDVVMRTIAQVLSEMYRQQVLVENRPGAGGLIGATAVATAPPDGYMIGLAGPAHVLAPQLQAKPPYRPIEDFTPIVELGTLSSVLVVGAGVPAKNTQELIALAKSKPGQLNYASLGDGTASHLAGALFTQAAGINVVHVPFKSVADVFQAVISGDVHYVNYLVPLALPLLRDGKARALAVTGQVRFAALPDIPTMAEAGLPGANLDAMLGIVGPANLPREIVQQLHADIVAVLRRQDTRERLATQALMPSSGTATPDSYGAHLKAEYEVYRKLIATLGLKRQ